jgi:alpha-beta hydrolase superfamily lysophospholipase
MTFYVGFQRFAAPDLVAAGYDVLAVNRRSAGIAGIRDSFASHGDAWTLWAQHRMDADAAVAHLRAQGYARIVMAGHSQGGLLAADHAVRVGKAAGVILASPASNFAGPPAWLPEPERTRLIAQARALLAEGRPRDLVLLPQWPWITSAEAIVDPLAPGVVTPLADLLAEYRGPVLIFCGDQGRDTALLGGARAAFDRCPSPAKRLEPLPGSDHFYVGHEARVIALMTAWLAEHVPAL